MTEDDYRCERCGRPESDVGRLIPLDIQITNETWDLCDPCIDAFEEWVEAGTDE